MRENYQTEDWAKWVVKTDQELLGRVSVDSYVGSGKGGQKRNKTSNAVRLRLAHLQVDHGRFRSKQENQKQALRKLRLAMAFDFKEDLSPRNQDLTLPSELKNNLAGGLIRIQPKNPLFPLFIGILVDLYLEHKGDEKMIASQLGVSPSQLRKFIMSDSTLATKFQELRQKYF